MSFRLYLYSPPDSCQRCIVTARFKIHMYNSVSWQGLDLSIDAEPKKKEEPVSHLIDRVRLSLLLYTGSLGVFLTVQNHSRRIITRPLANLPHSLAGQTPNMVRLFSVISQWLSPPPIIKHKTYWSKGEQKLVKISQWSFHLLGLMWKKASYFLDPEYPSHSVLNSKTLQEQPTLNFSHLVDFQNSSTRNSSNHNHPLDVPSLVGRNASWQRTTILSTVMHDSCTIGVNVYQVSTLQLRQF